MKFCKDCRHFAGKQAAVECTHPNNGVRIDLVDGTTRREWASAGALRLPGLCGPEGEWFEPRTELPAEQAAA